MPPSATREHPSYGALKALVKVSGLLRKAGDRFFQEYGLTQSQFNVLMVLQHDVPGGTTQTDLCRRLLVNAADVTGLVRRLLARRWVERADDPGDERAWIVRLSPKGRALLSRVEPTYYAKIERVMGVHTAGQCRTFLDLLERTRRALEAEAP